MVRVWASNWTRPWSPRTRREGRTPCTRGKSGDRPADRLPGDHDLLLRRTPRYILNGLLTRSRGSTLSNLTGAAASISAVLLIRTYTELAWPWFIVTGSLVTFAVAFAGRTTSAVLERFRVAEAGAAQPVKLPLEHLELL